MRFVNNNWYIALAFCLVFFIGGRQLAEAGGGSSPRARRLTGAVLLAFALPALLFPLAPLLRQVAAAPWYNTFRSINRIELYSALIAPFAGYATYLAPGGPLQRYGAPVASAVARVLKPVAFPVCVLLVSMNFLRPVLLPLPGGTVFADEWTGDGVLYQSAASASGPAALISAMYSLNRFADSELAAARGMYTDGAGTDFWYMARYAVNRGYRRLFYAPERPEDMAIPSVARLNAPGGAYVAILARSDKGVLTVGDPAVGRLELLPEAFTERYGACELALALSLPAEEETEP